MIVKHFLVLVMLAVPLVAGRQDRLPEFEAASIKPDHSGEARFTFTYQGNTFNATNVTLRMLIRNAYQVQDAQISGGPDWVNTDRFDIVAKADLSSTAAFPVQQREGPSHLQLMMRKLLADRFRLIVRSVAGDRPVYALKIAREDGRLGAQLRRSITDCATPATARDLGTPIRCGISMGIGTLTLGGGSLLQLANSLSNLVGRPVVDRTGLTGTFDLTLTWTPESMSQRQPTDATDLPATRADGPSIFTAVREQLGLKLDSQKGGADALVIDRVERPAEN
jgi:uncharacterized protein (TIGR03435 family)